MRYVWLPLLVVTFLLASTSPAQQTPDRPEPPSGVSRPERPDRASALITRADTDRDGRVSFDEMQALRPGITPKQFQSIDRNGDGYLTTADRPPMPTRAQVDARRQLLAQLLQSDRDEDGVVSLDEVASAKPGFPKSTFDRLDANSDGVLTQEDLDQFTRRADRPHRPSGSTRQTAGSEKRSRLMQRLIQADTDGSGSTTFEEAQAALPGISRERFERLDVNTDGVLDQSDWWSGPVRP